jgi:carboxylesterase type B
MLQNPPDNGRILNAANRGRVLINLHGGAFLWGAHSGGLVESIPVASVGKLKVISVDYRQGPEATFPAASEDVAAVYTALLKRYEPQNIGIYGCSAGGVLTAQSVAWIAAHGLPRPGAGTSHKLVRKTKHCLRLSPLSQGLHRIYIQHRSKDREISELENRSARRLIAVFFRRTESSRVRVSLVSRCPWRPLRGTEWSSSELRVAMKSP